MSRYGKKQNSYKKGKTKGIITGAVSVLAITLLVGGLGALTKGFQDWTFDFGTQEVVGERENLRVIDLETKLNSGSVLNSATLLSYLNDGLDTGIDPIFSDIAYVEKEVISTTTNEETGEEETSTTIEKEYLCQSIYKAEGGMKFGTTTALGSFTADLVEDYSFNCAKIIGRNYSTLSSTTNIYSCDESSIVVNGAEAQVFGTNEEDTSVIAPLEEKTFKFEDMQDQLSISVLGKRAVIYTIELWTE